MSKIITIKDLKNTSEISGLYQVIEVAEQEVTEGKTLDAKDAIKKLRNRYGL